MRLEVPDRVRDNALATPGGAQWLETLPQTVAALAAQWDLTVERAFGAGTEGFAVAVTTADGRPGALKVEIPGLHPDAREPRILEAASGRGYARLIAWDAERCAWLMERLGPQLAQGDLAIDDQIGAIVAALKAAWAVPAAPLGLPTARDKACELGAIIADWDAAGRPCAERTRDVALKYLERRAAAFDPATAVLCHGDAHAWNTLTIAGEPGRVKLIDPDGYFAEPAYDLCISLREWCTDLLAGDPMDRGRARCARLAALGEVEAQAIWEWALPERVANGILHAKMGWQDLAGPGLRVADAWATEA